MPERDHPTEEEYESYQYPKTLDLSDHRDWVIINGKIGLKLVNHNKTLIMHDGRTVVERPGKKAKPAINKEICVTEMQPRNGKPIFIGEGNPLVIRRSPNGNPRTFELLQTSEISVEFTDLTRKQLMLRLTEGLAD